MTTRHRPILPLLASLTLASAAFGALGCSSEEADVCHISIAAGEDAPSQIQAALIDAAPGSTICIGEGTYAFVTELSATKPNLRIKGAGSDKTILDFKNQDLGANGVTLTGDHVIVEDLWVKNTPGDGIRATAVKDVVFRRLKVSWDTPMSLENGAYALYPVQCEDVLIEECEITGSRDAGIYVGQSRNILVANNDVYGNVAGIEIENSSDAEVRDNHAHDNVGGILVFNLPGLPVKNGKRANVHHNLVENNNIPTFAEPGTTVADVPPGMGIMILASDHNEVHHNTIQGNKTIGTMIISYTDLVFPPWEDTGFDPFPQGNYVHDNMYSNNGTDPEGLIGILIQERPVPDIVWDGCVDQDVAPSDDLSNCAGGNGSAVVLDVALCGGDRVHNPPSMSCEQPSLPAQTP